MQIGHGQAFSYCNAGALSLAMPYEMQKTSDLRRESSVPD